MKRTKTTDLPYVKLKITLEKYNQLVQEGFEAKLQTMAFDAKQTKQIITALESAFSKIKSTKFAVDGTVELVQFPLGSLSASGKFKDADAGTIVYVPGTGKHKPYIRTWAKSDKPRTGAQLNHLALFGQVNTQWAHESQEIRALWDEQAKLVHAYCGQNLYVHTWFEVGKETGQYPGLGFRP